MKMNLVSSTMRRRSVKSKREREKETRGVYLGTSLHYVIDSVEIMTVSSRFIGGAGTTPTLLLSFNQNKVETLSSSLFAQFKPLMGFFPLIQLYLHIESSQTCGKLQFSVT